ncbi:Uncharacterized protein TCM_019247 [Theobroma cacao]|uniref:Integrase catalytic domain-containing protein n=1 Tax=Theobroma cacao TaxID=3641 RepID=A0A061EG57_THECC|nr:Uncharacterized protein TCM_019247 [Theobroma cacao]
MPTEAAQALAAFFAAIAGQAQTGQVPPVVPPATPLVPPPIQDLDATVAKDWINQVSETLSDMGLAIRSGVESNTPSHPHSRPQTRTATRVFVVTEDEARVRPGAVTGTMSLFDKDVYVLIDSGSDRSYIKAEHQKLSGTLQPLSIPEWKWEHVIMDFVLGLPQTQSGKDAIWVIVDRLTKSAHFLAIHSTYSIERLARLYIDEIVRLHGVPVSIVSDRDPRFTSRFWPKFQEALGTKLRFSTAFHPQKDGQSERTIQTLEDMLWAYVIDFIESWDKHLPLVEFAYNNSFQSSIGMAPYEALYGRKCRTPLCWDEVGERKLVNVELIDLTNDKVKVIRERLKTAQDRQKNYSDKRRKDLEFEVDDKVFLKVSPWKGVIRFAKRGKLNPRYIGPFCIIERIGPVAYRLELPPELDRIHNVFHVSMLKKYVPDPSHILETPPIELHEYLKFEVQPVRILDRKDRVLRNKSIPMVKVLWKNARMEEMTTNLVKLSILYCVKVVSPPIKARKLHPRTSRPSASKVCILDIDASAKVSPRMDLWHKPRFL